GPIPLWTGGKKASELSPGEHTLLGAQWMRPLVALQPVERMRRDVAAAKREREDAAERAEDALDRPGRQPGRLQLADAGDDIVGGDQRQPAATEPGQQVTAELRAVEIERPIAPLTRRDLRFELG